MPTINVINTLNPVIQIVNSSTSAVVTCNTVIPADDTIPQNTEGTQILTLSVTPKKITNLLHISFEGIVSNSATSNLIQVALFQDTTANALSAVRGCEEVGNSSSVSIMLDYIMAAGTTSSTTFKIRIGPDANTCYINGDNTGTRLYGGVAATSLVIREFEN